MPAPPAAGLSVPTLEVETVVGRLLVHRDDEVITPNLVRWRLWEAAETAFLRSTIQAGDTFVDVGANVGYFTVLGAACVGERGTVVAVEPEPRNLELLRANVARHGCTQTSVLPVAAYSRAGWMSLSLNERNRGDHRLAPAGATTTRVRCVRLDDVLPARVDVVKVDVQGVDHDVIAGLERTIAANPQVVVLAELSLRQLAARRVEPADVLAGYAALGLTLAVLDEPAVPRAVSPEDAISHCAAAWNAETTLVLRR